MEVPKESGPPQSSSALLKALKAVPNAQKENRPTTIFDRQPTAQRVEFGDGFDDTQPTPGPSNIAKGKQPAQPSSRKRPRSVVSDSESEAFDAEDRSLRVPDRRRNVPVSKKARFNPVSSGAPTSHQPPRRLTQQEPEQEESVSENEAPDMTEDEPPPSSYAAQAKLAKLDRLQAPPQGERKTREAWSTEATEALMNYMGIYPCKYSTILQHDLDEGSGLLQNRTQVQLKDKARNMAINMIK